MDKILSKLPCLILISNWLIYFLVVTHLTVSSAFHLQMRIEDTLGDAVAAIALALFILGLLICKLRTFTHVYEVLSSLLICFYYHQCVVAIISACELFIQSSSFHLPLQC